MKTFSCALIVALVSASLLRAELPPKFLEWNVKRGPCKTAEFSKVEIKALFTESQVKLTDGSQVAVSSITALSPEGLRFMSSSGIELVAFPSLPLSLAEITGWTDDIRAEWTKAKRAETGQVQTSASKAVAQQQQAERRKFSRDINYMERHGFAPTNEATAIAASKGASTSAQVPAPTSKSRTVGEIIDAYALSRWPGDYVMQEWEKTRQLRDYIAYAKIRDDGYAGVPEESLKFIITKARREWMPDYSMVKWEVERQCQAFVRLGR